MLCPCVLSAEAQLSKPKVKISVLNESEVKVEIELLSPAASWSFRNAYAGVLGLGQRIKRFEAIRANEQVSVRTIATGEFRCDSPAEKVAYVASISPGRPSDLAHVSWLTRDSGILMLADLLPESPDLHNGALVTFELPAGWLVHSAITPEEGNRYSVSEPEKAVFFLGRALRVMSRLVHGMELQLVVNSSWAFSDKSVLNAASKVLEDYFGLTGFRLRSKPTIFLTSLPFTDSNSQWKAEARGSTVILLMDPRAKIRNWMAQLGIIFTHEIFHLWLPNSLPLTGDYDWFFEGVTLYTALQAALRLNLIGFQEYLRTLARVYDSYLSYPDDQTLIEASERRWTSATPAVYDKGMLVAFIYDLTIRLETSGKVSLGDCYRSLFGQHAQKPANANDVIIKLLTSSPATEGFSKAYIENKNRIHLEQILPSFGLEIVNGGSGSSLTVSRELTDTQQKLLKSLGYHK
jgi:predicted metalloprotease with PDZ domain